MNTAIKIALIDDHVLLRNALAKMINNFDECQVVIQADHGKDYIEQLKSCKEDPDVILLDLNMPEMDGYATASWINKHQPQAKVLMLTMYDSEHTLIRLLQSGVKGFLKKDVEPTELKFAIGAVIKSGFYYSTQTAGKLVNLFRGGVKDPLRYGQSALTDQEVDFLAMRALI